MKTLGFFLTGALLVALGGTGHTQAPDLQAGVYVKAGSSSLAVDRHSAPFVVDWNNDGKKDLLVGQFTYGNIWLYLNQGTDKNPRFTTGSKIKANGSPLTTTYG